MITGVDNNIYLNRYGGGVALSSGNRYSAV
jgi:hypothetical protein